MNLKLRDKSKLLGKDLICHGVSHPLMLAKGLRSWLSPDPDETMAAYKICSIG